MREILAGIQNYGFAGGALAVLLYVLFKGELVFRYPRRDRRDSIE